MDLYNADYIIYIYIYPFQATSYNHFEVGVARRHVAERDQFSAKICKVTHVHEIEFLVLTNVTSLFEGLKRK